MPVWSDFRKELRISEGSIPHMYLDTVGKVTVGVGNMLPNVAAAEALPFVNRGTGGAASKEDIKTDFENVTKQPKGRRAGWYRQHTKLDLPEKAIDSLLNTRIDSFKRELRLVFPDFDKYPAGAQFALLDMAFNLGTHGLVSKFPNFKKAVESRDWLAAAKESNRHQVSPARNAKVREWLEQAQGS